MNLELILKKYDESILNYTKIYEKEKIKIKIINSTSDISNDIIILNNDKYNRFILAYIKKSNNKIKFIWSWKDINMNNNNNTEIKKIFDYGIKLNDINNNFNDNIKYYLINNTLNINIFELDIILAISLYILNADYVTINKLQYKNYEIIYILKKIS